MTTSEKRFFYFSVFLHCQYCLFAATCCKKTLCLSHFKQLQYLQAVTNNARRHIHTHRHAGTYIPIPGKVTFCWQRQYIFSLSIKNQSHSLSFMLYSPLHFLTSSYCQAFKGICVRSYISSYLIAIFQSCGLSVLGLSIQTVHTRSHKNCSYSNVHDQVMQVYSQNLLGQPS